MLFIKEKMKTLNRTKERLPSPALSSTLLKLVVVAICRFSRFFQNLPDHLSLRPSSFVTGFWFILFLFCLYLLLNIGLVSLDARPAGLLGRRRRIKKGFATERRPFLIRFVQSFVGLLSHGTRLFTSASRIQPDRDGIRCFGLIRFAIETTTDILKTGQKKSKSVFIVPLPPVHRYWFSFSLSLCTQRRRRRLYAFLRFSTVN